MKRFVTVALSGLLIAMTYSATPGRCQTFNYLPKVLDSRGIPWMAQAGESRGNSFQAMFRRPRSYGHLRLKYPRAPRPPRRSGFAFHPGLDVP